MLIFKRNITTILVYAARFRSTVSVDMFLCRKVLAFAGRQLTVTTRLLVPFKVNGSEGKNRCAASAVKLDPPLPPKRPLTAYLVFCKENRNIVLKENPSLSASEQTKVLAEKWNSLGPASRKFYEDIARKSVISYAEAHKKYYESLTESQRQSLMELKAKKKQARENLRVKRLLKESGVPKPPLTAYTLFQQSEAKTKNIVSLGEFNKEVSTAWRSLPDVEKQIFVSQAKKEKETYELEMKAWREKCVKEGKQDLVRAYCKRKLKAKANDEESKLVPRKKERN